MILDSVCHVVCNICSQSASYCVCHAFTPSINIWHLNDSFVLFTNTAGSESGFVDLPDIKVTATFCVQELLLDFTATLALDTLACLLKSASSTTNSSFELFLTQGLTTVSSISKYFESSARYIGQILSPCTQTTISICPLSRVARRCRQSGSSHVRMVTWSLSLPLMNCLPISKSVVSIALSLRKI